MFLEKYPFLPSFLEEVAVACERYFSGARLFLEVDIDRELGIEELLLFIGVPRDSGRAYDRLKKFDHEWWIPHMDLAKGKLSTHLEYMV